MTAYPVQHVRIKRFAELTGYTENAVRQKIEKGVWAEGRHYKKAPDGRVLIDLEAFDQWVNDAA